MNENGTEDLIPAYGKDLEDAISRIKHDKRVEIIEKTTRKVPIVFWLCMWLLYMLGITSLQYELDEPMVIIAGLSFAGFFIIFVMWWTQNRNVDKDK
jgi:heme A synthase